MGEMVRKIKFFKPKLVVHALMRNDDLAGTCVK